MSNMLRKYQRGVKSSELRDRLRYKQMKCYSCDGRYKGQGNTSIVS